MAKKVAIGKGMKVSREKLSKMNKKPGGSNVGRYKNVPKKDFAGPKGDSPQGSFPISTEKKAKAALAYSGYAPKPQAIKKAVYKKYPALKKRKEKREGKK